MTQELTKAQIGRIAIRMFKTTADALSFSGSYKPNGQSGKPLETALRTLSPEIYGSMNDMRRIEIEGIVYVIDRLPRGIESASRIVLTAQEDFLDTSFEIIIPSKRRRTSYRVCENEMCFIITRGQSEIYDIITHLTFLNIEAKKIARQMKDESCELTKEWRRFEEHVRDKDNLSGKMLDQALWNLSIILGVSYKSIKTTYDALEKSRKEKNANSGLFEIIYSLGKRADAEINKQGDELLVYFTPSLMDIIGRHSYSRNWAANVKKHLIEKGYIGRPVHLISANMHSVRNLLYGYAALKDSEEFPTDFYSSIKFMRNKEKEIASFALDNGFSEIIDHSGSHIDCQLIDTLYLDKIPLSPELAIDADYIVKEKPVLLVMDYAFGTQAFEVLEEILAPFETPEGTRFVGINSISVMGKAGILTGNKGDIMLATAHVLEGTTHTYPLKNALTINDFDENISVFTGPMVTVFGTSLQNRDVLEIFKSTSWKAIGLEMEGGHYQRAISAAVLKGYIPESIKVMYAYYASDNPLVSGQTLASGSMGDEGIRPTYMITKIILEKILG